MSVTAVNLFTKNKMAEYNICTTSAQRLRRWSNIVQMLYKCFVFTAYDNVDGNRPTYSTTLHLDEN